MNIYLATACYAFLLAGRQHRMPFLTVLVDNLGYLAAAVLHDFLGGLDRSALRASLILQCIAIARCRMVSVLNLKNG